MRHELINGNFTLPQLVYAGEMPTPTKTLAIAPTSWNWSYVYHVFDGAGDLLYVGMSGVPFARWGHHRRKAKWWQLGVHLNLYRVIGKDHNTATLGARFWESKAIHGALPRFNQQGPSTLPSKAGGR